MTQGEPSPSDHRLTRRQTLGFAGAAGTAVVLGGGAGRVISQLAEDPAEVTAATAARACRLTPEVTAGLAGKIVVGVNPKARPRSVQRL
jgi:hypothetical protein